MNPIRTIQTNRSIILVTAIILIHTISGSICLPAVNEKIPFYNMKAVIRPESSEIFVLLDILNPDDSSFYLCRNFEIRNIEADGEKVQFSVTKSDFMSFSKLITLKTKLPEKLTIEYSGKLIADSFPRITSVVNMISPHLVEMAIYTMWYPRFRSFKAFYYKIETEVPAGFVTVINGQQTGEKIDGKSVISTWESFAPVGDILFFSAPGMKKKEIETGNLSVEVYYDKIPESYIDSMKTNLIKSMVLLKENISTKMTNNLLRVVYSPRPGWGYVRTPFIIVDEASVLNQLQTKYYQARNFRYITHEIAHYWWSLANTATSDDWINEGLSEYCSLWISEEVYGKVFTEQLVKEYIERSEKARADVSIAETTGGSDFREVNRYDKPALFFYFTARRYGKEKMLDFMSSFYEDCLKSKSVTTLFFLDEVESYFGKKARDYFGQTLFSREWNLERIKSGF
jgi:hypothetical protein